MLTLNRHFNVSKTTDAHSAELSLTPIPLDKVDTVSGGSRRGAETGSGGGSLRYASAGVILGAVAVAGLGAAALGPIGIFGVGFLAAVGGWGFGSSFR
ncbi:MAG: hypothetical protein AAF749_06330 [Pseudomonadota bacterium]